ncbi:MAG: hypothetical protein H7Y20_01770 [Bryobacteraceae bacterium]|nr:hypothetical protein [Bryobacteraceae bacterium]
MTYRVTFRKRFNSDAEEADRPETFVRVEEGVVLTAIKAEVIDPPALHSQDTLDEDDDFESLGTETWEYEIADGRGDEFVTALENSGMVIDYENVDDVTI